MIGWLIFGGIVLLIAILLALSATVVIDIENNISVEIKYFLFKILVFPETEERKKRRKKKEKKKAAKEKKRLEKQKKKQDKLSKKQSRKKKTDKSAGKTAKKTSTAEKTVKSDNKPKPDVKQTENRSDGESDSETKEKTEEKSESKSEENHKANFDFETIKGMIDSASLPIKRLFRKIRVNDVYIDIVAGGEDSAKVALTYGTLYAVICPILEWLKSVITFKVEELNIEADFEKEKTDYFVHAKAKLRLSTALGCAIWLLFRFIRNSVKSQTANTPQPKTGGNKNGTAS